MAKQVTLKERQKLCDISKWLESKEKGDMSGKMDYCEYCSQNFMYTCRKTQAQREADSLCAKAYNKMQKANKKA